MLLFPPNDVSKIVQSERAAKKNNATNKDAVEESAVLK
jgi:hypothetical protein